jgi:peroxiredoxin
VRTFAAMAVYTEGQAVIRISLGETKKTKNRYMAIPAGSKAPEFALKSKNASGLVDVKLSNNFGKTNTVVLFFPLAFTSVCTTEMCDVTSGLQKFKDLNAEVIGISVDSPFAQEAWAQKEKIGIPLASDLNGPLMRRLRRFWETLI